MGTKSSNFHLLYFLFLLISCATSLISHASASNITQGQSIKDGQTLISSAQNFELGFFSTVNSTKRYVGIWYYKIPVRTVVWVANRESPVLDSSGVFTVGEDGNLKVLNGQGQPLWSTNISSTNSNSTAVFKDDGNLILCRSEEAGESCRGLWQSFNDPTDTYLPGMRVGLNRRTGERQMFRSWRSESDPSTGNFSMSMDPSGEAQIVVWNGSRRLWRSGLWNGQVFIGVPNMRSAFNIYGFSFSNDNNDPDGEMYFTYSAFNREIIRFRIRWDGREEQLRWDERNKNWTVFWQQTTDECKIYNWCGAFASCNPSGSGKRCSCVRGFEPKNINEWNGGNWSGGCVRRKRFLCQRNNTTDSEQAKPDGFLVRDGVKLPDFSTLKAVDSREQCEAECLKNCSCNAYAHGNGLGCLTWTSDLVDIEDFTDGGYKLYIRVANSELDRKSKSWKIAVIIAVVSGTLILITSAYLYWRFRGRVKGLCRKGDTETHMLEVSKSREFGMDFSGQHDIGEEEDRSAPDLPLYSFQSIVTATNNFSKANLLGQGGFGPVYKGKLPCGTEIAVKRLSRQSGQGLTEFQTEVKLIARLQHRNLVRLLGCCIQGEERILLYEYLPNKSLDAFIFDSTNQMQLDWAKRFDIIEGIARGLLYLHRDSRLRVIHRDLKASNILLDEEMNPKISDFGMAKIFGGNQNQANTNRLVGTYGYMSPEYAMEGLFSVKSDVYSFGVLLLEIVSGKKNTQYRNREHSKNLLGYAWKLWNEQNAIELVDPYIRDSSCSISDIVRCIHIGLLCVQDSALDRPNMSSVVLMLASETTTLPMPRDPTFTVGSSIGMDLFLENSEGLSKNDVTVTMTVGR